MCSFFGSQFLTEFCRERRSSLWALLLKCLTKRVVFFGGLMRCVLRTSMSLSSLLCLVVFQKDSMHSCFSVLLGDFSWSHAQHVNIFEKGALLRSPSPPSPLLPPSSFRPLPPSSPYPSLPPLPLWEVLLWVVLLSFPSSVWCCFALSVGAASYSAFWLVLRCRVAVLLLLGGVFLPPLPASVVLFGASLQVKKLCL